MGITAAKLQVVVEGDTRSAEMALGNFQKGVMGSFGGVLQTGLGVLTGNLMTGALRNLAGLGAEALGAVANHERLGQALETLTAKELVASSAVTTTTTSMRKATQAEIDRAAWLERTIATQQSHLETLERGSNAYLSAEARLRTLRGELAGLAIDENGMVTSTSKSTDATLSMADALAQAGPKAQELLRWIQMLAIKSPFTQEGVAQAFKTAMAYGFTAEESQRLTQAMIDFSAGTGATEGAMSQIALALGQIQAKGKLSGQEVLQLVNAGLSVDAILAKAFGKSTEEIVAMREKGLIPADQAIEAIVSSLEKDFGGAAERQSTTFAGLISTLGDIKQVGLREFFSGAFEAVKPLVSSLTDWLQGPGLDKLRSWGEQVGKFTAKVVDLVGAFVDAGPNSIEANEALSAMFGPEAAGAIQTITGKIQEFFAFIAEHQVEIQGAAMAIGGLFAAFGAASAVGTIIAALANPITLILGLVGLLGAAWAGNWGGIQEKTKAVIDWASPYIQGFIKGVQDWWAQHGPGIMAKAGEIWSGIQAKTEEAIAWLGPKIEGFIKGVQDWWAQHGPGIMAKAGEIWEGIKQGFELFKEGLAATFSLFQSAFEGDWETFGKKLREGWDKTWEGIKELFSKAVEWFNSVDWAAVGKSILEGIAAGIAAGAQLIIDAAKAAARAALEAAKGFLGIESPSQVFADEVGKQISAGIAQGIMVNAHLPKLALQAAAPSWVAAGAGAAAGAVTVSAPSGGDVYYEQHFYTEGTAALAMAEMAQARRARLNGSMGV